MHTNTAAAGKNRQSGIEKIVEILNSDVIIFPKTILKCDEVYEESKMLFSVIFTHSLQNHAEDSNICRTVTQEMIHRSFQGSRCKYKEKTTRVFS